MIESRLAAAALLAGLSGCAASIPPVSVTRFHGTAAIAQGTTALAAPSVSMESATYDAAVMRELARLGYPAGNAPTKYTVAITAERSSRDAAPRQSPVTIGVGGGTGGFGGGVGIGASFGLGRNHPRTITVTRLSVQLSDRASGAAVWEGRAETESPSTAPAAQPGLAAEKLATALFKDFPGPSGQTITVP